MINFFRKIRYTLMEKNKTGKYLKYAIGEVVLVVIGILIALQVNNWNENKKLSVYEEKMLNEVYQEMIEDTLYFSSVLKRPEIINKNMDKLINLYDSKTWDLDSITKYSSYFPMTFNYTYRKGAYESIKSVGIDRITNDSVRLLVTNLYDFVLPRNERNIYLREGLEQQKLDSYIDQFFVPVLTDLPNGQKRLFYKPKHPKIFEDPDFLRLIILKKSYAINSMNRLRDVLSWYRDVIPHLKKELNIE